MSIDEADYDVIDASEIDEDAEWVDIADPLAEFKTGSSSARQHSTKSGESSLASSAESVTAVGTENYYTPRGGGGGDPLPPPTATTTTTTTTTAATTTAPRPADGSADSNNKPPSQDSTPETHLDTGADTTVAATASSTTTASERASGSISNGKAAADGGDASESESDTNENNANGTEEQFEDPLPDIGSLIKAEYTESCITKRGLSEKTCAIVMPGVNVNHLNILRCENPALGTLAGLAALPTEYRHSYLKLSERYPNTDFDVFAARAREILRWIDAQV